MTPSTPRNTGCQSYLLLSTSEKSSLAFTEVSFQKSIDSATENILNSFVILFFADNLLNESEVLTWLRINRYKRIELNWIMYMVLLAALAFLSYSAFIIYGLQPKEPELKKED